MKALWRMSIWGVVGIVGSVGSAAAVLGPVGLVRPAAAAVVVEAAEYQPQNSDAMLTAVIKAKLESIRLMRHAEVTVVTENGVVTVIGTIPSEAARVQAMDAVSGTPGVVRINDQLRVIINSPEAPSHN